MFHGNQNVRVEEKNGGMASGILRASMRFGLLLAFLILVGALTFLLQA